MSKGSGTTRAWRKVALRKLADNRTRNGGRCELAVAGVCTLRAEQVHHVRGRTVTGNDPRYLAAACGPCNRHVGDPQRHPAACPCGWGLRKPAPAPRPRPQSKW